MRRTRNTPQRRAVLSAVCALDSQHPTAAEVFNEVRRENPRLSLATVYRALEALCEQGELAELKLENTTRYCVGASPHHHIVCRKCGTVADVCTEVFPEQAIRHLEACSGFSVELRPVQFFGTCPLCSALDRSDQVR